jgi:hypothetical protein
MIAPLIEFSRISEKDFFTNTEARRNEYFSLVRPEYDFSAEKIVDGERGIYFQDGDHNREKFLTYSGIYVKECYDELERKEMLSLKEKVYSILDTEKTELYIRYVIKELSHILTTVQEFELNEILHPYKVAIVAKLQHFITYIETSYLDVLPSVGVPKIQWLDSTKLLTTLFYDLINGQEKVNKQTPNTKPFIKAKTADIERLLIANFLDEDGHRLDPGTVKKYFNKSYEEGRVREGARIELEFR